MPGFCGAIIDDYKRRSKVFVSDFTDGCVIPSFIPCITHTTCCGRCASSSPCADCSRTSAHPAASAPDVDPYERVSTTQNVLISDFYLIYFILSSLCRFHLKTLSSFLFMFFATFASTVALGVVVDDRGKGTNKCMGVTELVMSLAIAGCIHSLVAGCPMAVLRPTGELMHTDAHASRAYLECDPSALAFEHEERKRCSLLRYSC